MAKSSFKLEQPLERRQPEAARIREKYPDRIPISGSCYIHFCEEHSAPNCVAAMLSAIYEENKDEDGFLYITYSGENTFGIIEPYDQGISV